MFISLTKTLAKKYDLEYLKDYKDSKTSQAYFWCAAVKKHDEDEFLFLINRESEFLVVMKVPEAENFTEEIKSAIMENFMHLGVDVETIKTYFECSGAFEYGALSDKSLRTRLNTEAKEAFKRIDYYREKNIDFDISDIGPEVSILPIRKRGKEKSSSLIPRAKMNRLLEDYNFKKDDLTIHYPEIYEIKSTLMGSEVKTERTFLLESDRSFNDLAAILMDLYDFNGFHLYQFDVFNKNRKTRPDFIIEDENREEDFFFPLFGPQPVSKPMSESIESYFKTANHIVFNYDFGDDWNIKLVLKGSYPGAPDTDLYLPYLLSLSGPSPIEDMGGIWRYNDLINMKLNPESYKDDPYVEDFLEWLGDAPFNPDEKLALPRKIV